MTNTNTGLDTLIKLLKDVKEDPQVRIGAAVGLAHAGGSKALSALEDILIHFSSSPPQVRAAAATALGQVIGRTNTGGAVTPADSEAQS